MTVSVTDTGLGVPPDLRERVFDRFVRGDPARHGASSGLGLAIAAENARLLAARSPSARTGGPSFSLCPGSGYRPQMTTDIEEYIAGFPADVAERLRQVRATMVDEVTRALGSAPSERVRYGIAAVMLDDRATLHYAGWKHHIGLYPVHVLPPELEAEVAPLRAAKDTVKLVHSRPLPLDLVARITAEGVAHYRA